VCVGGGGGRGGAGGGGGGCGGGGGGGGGRLKLDGVVISVRSGHERRKIKLCIHHAWNWDDSVKSRIKTKTKKKKK